jgi:hypothetical protein
VERERIELDYCPVCRGLWFDAGELELLAEKRCRGPGSFGSGVPAQAATRETARRCPRCDRGLDQVRMGATPVLVDRCGAGHGLWFDRDELGALVRQTPPAPGSRAEAVLQFMGEQFEAGGLPAEPAAAGEPTRSGEEKR